MQINFLLQNLNNFLRVSPSSRSRAPAVPQPAQPETSSTNRPDLLRARRQLVRILDSLAEVDRLINGQTRSLTERSSAISTPALSLNLTPTATTLNSASEINATPTSFSPFVTTWTSWSTAPLAVGGVYDGSNGSGELSFESLGTGIRQFSNINIRVRDPQNNNIIVTTVKASDPITTQYDIGNGLFFTLGNGAIARRDTTSTNIYADVGSVVDPAKPFNGTGNNNPNYEFGTAPIVDGSFQLNGETINVSAGDNLNDVVDAINSSNADVAATFNAQTERIELTRQTSGSAPDIEITNDTSNFIAATKLDVSASAGIDTDNIRPLADVGAFSSAQGGNALVNGTQISVDPQTDSLDDIVARINASDSGAVAEFDAANLRVSIAGASAQDTLTLDSNGTALFGAFNIADGTIEKKTATNGFSQGRTRRIVAAVQDTADALNTFFSATGSKPDDPAIASLQATVKAAVESVVGVEKDEFFGLTLNTANAGSRYLKVADLDRSLMTRRLRSRGRDVQQFFSGSSGQAGFLQALNNSARQATVSLNSRLGVKGTLFDAVA